VKRIACSLAFLASISVAPVSFADGLDPRTATEFFARGREAVKKADFATAVRFFGESNRLDPKVGTLLNLADAEEHVGQLASARQHWQQAVDLARSLSDERANLAAERFGAIDKRVPKLILKAPANPPAGMTVKRDGVELSAVAFGLPLPADPGDHTITISAPGRVARAFHVELKEGERKEVQLDLAPSATDASVPPTTPVNAPVIAVTAPPAAITNEPKPKPEEPATSHSSRKTLAYVVGGFGIVGVGVGTIFGVQAISKNSASNAEGHCTADGCDTIGKSTRNEALAAARISTVAFILGGAALATGVVLFVTAPSDRKSDQKAARVEAGAQVGPGNATFTLKGTW
jgi:hypothetical protein